MSGLKNYWIEQAWNYWMKKRSLIGRIPRQDCNNGRYITISWAERLKTVWRWTVKKEWKEAGWSSWEEMRTIAADREKWRTSVNALCAMMHFRRIATKTTFLFQEWNMATTCWHAVILNPIFLWVQIDFISSPYSKKSNSIFQEVCWCNCITLNGREGKLHMHLSCKDHMGVWRAQERSRSSIKSAFQSSGTRRISSQAS